MRVIPLKKIIEPRKKALLKKSNTIAL
jgi:hypothetical protein